MQKSKLLVFLIVAFVLLLAASACNAQRHAGNKSGKGKTNGQGKIKTLLLEIFEGSELRKTPPPSVCSKKNPFLTHLYQRGVDLFDQPQIHAGGCPSEWKAHGTCCNHEQLREYASKDQADITHAADLLVDHFLQFVLAVKPLYTMLSVLNDNKEDPRRENYLALKLLKSFDQNNLKYFASLMDLINSPEEILNYQTETKTCWAKATDMRKAALCETCSGRSQIFFEKKLAKISQRNCEDLMLVCAKSFSFTVQFLKVLGILSRDIQDSGLINSNHWKTKNQLSQLCSISQEIGSGHLACKMNRLQKKTKTLTHSLKDSQATDSMPPKPSDKVHDDLIEVSDLCDKFLRLSKDPFILTIADYFDINLHIFTKAYEVIRDNQQSSSICKLRQSRSGNWRLGKRLLGLGVMTQSSSTSGNNMFTGDTKTCQTTTCQSMDMQEFP